MTPRGGGVYEYSYTKLVTAKSLCISRLKIMLDVIRTGKVLHAMSACPYVFSLTHNWHADHHLSNDFSEYMCVFY
jgi:hypothetical protein